MARNNEKLNTVNAAPALQNRFWEQVGKKLAASLSKKYRFSLHTASTSTSECTFSEWSEKKSQIESLHVSLFRAEGIRSPFFFFMNAASASVVCNLLLGGAGAEMIAPEPGKTFNHAPISQQLALRFVQVLAAQLESELAKFGCGSLKFCSSELDIRLYNQIPPEISCLSVDFSMSTGESPGHALTVTILIPVDAAKRLKLTKNAAEDSGVTLLSYKHLHDIEVDVAVTLSDLQMTLKELVELLPGDVLGLDMTRDQQPKLKVEGKLYKTGHLDLDDKNKWKFVVS